MHSSQENTNKRAVPNLKISVEVKDFTSTGNPRAEYYFTLVNTGHTPLIINSFTPYTKEIEKNMAILPSHTRVEFPLEIKASEIKKLILLESGTLPDLKQASFWDTEGKEWPVSPTGELLHVQNKIKQHHQAS